ncbi:hypothetical protein IC229_31930 [Spirosoma sp. BT702]|uniref:Uncharacterized protein n=1 Tax=Spirosoma profusum TaxID=2771354 RepID=A0A927AVR3_9BACT|nr:hypothetical protein [Spirosoma profusum]MBD2705271.1 hypothetical protein [Spirosoma profusum]
MKKLFGVLAIAYWLSLSASAQSLSPAKIHIYNGIAGIPIEIKTILNESTPLRIRSRTWTIIQTNGDSLGFVINNKPYFLHFESGKQYYFVAQISQGSHVVITEKSEREFILTATISSAKGPEEYNLSRVNN